MITKSLFSWEEREDWMHRGSAWKELTASLQLAFNSTPLASAPLWEVWNCNFGKV